MRIKHYLGMGGAAFLLAVAACEDNPFIVGRFGVAGGWAGATRVSAGAADSIQFNFELELEQDREDISGSATVTTTTAEFPLAVRGTWAATSSPQVNLTLVMSSESTDPLRFDAQFDVDSIPRQSPLTGVDVVTDTDTLVGTLHGSGLEGVKLRLGRTSTD